MLETVFGSSAQSAFADAAQRLGRTPGFTFFAFDLSQPYLMDTVLVTSFPTGADLGRLRNKYVHDSTRSGAVIVATSASHVGHDRVVRVISDDPADSLSTLAYLLVDSDTWWILEYSAPEARFGSLLPQYEGSVQTFVPRERGSGSPSSTSSVAPQTVVLRDDFSDASSGWVVSNDASSRTRYVADAYEVLAKEPKFANFLDLNVDKTWQDIGVQIDASKATPTTPDAWLGVTCPTAAGGHYVLAIDPNAAHYLIGRYAQSSKGLDFGATPAGVLRRDGVNRLLGDCRYDPTTGTTFLTFSVNGTQVATVEDKDGQGDFTGIRIYVSSFRGGTVATFDNAVLRA